MRGSDDFQPNSLEMGITSMVSILGEISRDTKFGIQMVIMANDKLTDIERFLTESVSSFIKNSGDSLINQSNTLLNKMVISLNDIQHNVQILVDKNLKLQEENIKLQKLNAIQDSPIFKTLADKFDKYINGPRPQNTRQFNENDVLIKEELVNVNSSIKLSNTWLSTISTQLTKIYKFLPKLSLDPKKAGISQEAESKTFDFANLARGMGQLKKNLTKKFINNFKYFLDVLNDFMLMDTKKLLFTGSVLISFSTMLKIVGTQAGIVSTNFRKLSFSILLVSLALISPPFILGGAILIATLWGIRKAIGTNIAANWAFGRLARGILLLTVAMFGMKYIPFDSVLKTITLIAGLSLVIKLFMGEDTKSTFSASLKGGIKGSSSGGIKGLTGFAFGIAILTVAMIGMSAIPYMSIFKMVGFIGLLGLTLKLFYSEKGFMGASKTKGAPGLTSFAFGIAILTLSLFAMNGMSWEAPLKLIGFIAMLGLTLKLFNGGKRGMFRGGPPALTSFAFGIGILVLSLSATNELNWGSVWKMLVFIGLLGLTLKTFSGFKSGKFSMGKSNATGLVSFSIGLGLLVLAMYAMNELPFEAMFKTLGFLAGLGLVMKLFSKGAGINMLLIASGMLVMAGAFMVISLAPITIEKILIFGGSILFISAVAAGLGVPAVSALVALGSGVMILLGISALVVAGTLGLLSLIPINFGRVAIMLGAMMLMALSFSMITPIALVGMVGAVLMLPIALTALMIAGTLALIKNVSFENVGAFLSSIFGMATMFAAVTPLAILAIIGATLLMPVAISALFFASVMHSIAKLNITQENIESYNSGVKSVVGTFKEFGVIEAGKAAAKSLLLLPVFASALVGALALKGISELNISESKLDSFNVFTRKFINSMTETITGNVDDLKKIEPGLKSLAKLVNVGSGLVDIVTSFANMNYNIYEVKDGKLKLVGVKKITDKEIKQVGVNIGKLIQGLLKPLAIVSSDDDIWDFGNGVKVKNPFAGGWFGDKNSGVNRLTKIGEAFLPLSDVIVKMGNMEILQNSEAQAQFGKGLLGTIGVLGQVFEKLETWENNDAEDSIENLADFIDGFEKIDELNFKSITDTMTKFLNNLSDDAKWAKINKNLTNLKNNFKDIAKNINMVNLEKAIILEKNLKILSGKETNDNLKEVIEKLAEMIGLLNEKSTGIIGNQQTQTSTQQETKMVTKVEEIRSEVMDNVNRVLEEINQKIEITNHKLSNKIKVVQIGTNNNSL